MWRAQSFQPVRNDLERQPDMFNMSGCKVRKLCGVITEVAAGRVLLQPPGVW
jgi:hypothetical protein